MRIKSYFADSVQEAIEKARIELGPDAMLMNSKKTDFELRALGSVEVVFGLPGKTAISKSRLQAKLAGVAVQEFPPAGVASTNVLSAAPTEVTQELADLRRQIETVKRSLNRHNRVDSAGDDKHSRTVENICSRLLAADISEDLAHEIAAAAESQAFDWKQSPVRGMRDFEIIPSETLELALSTELDRRFQVCPVLGVAGARQKIVVFVGPAGAGKTTSLIKLGLRYGLQARVPMHILSLDTLRVGGWEHLAAYARIAGLGFDAVHNLSSLEQRLAQHTDKKLILIDTPGFAPADEGDIHALSEWVKQFAALDVQLVLPATLRSSLVSRTVTRFAPLCPSKLLLTRADEAESPGILVDMTMRAGLPLSYLSNGQTIPEDITEPSKPELLACVTGGQLGRAKLEAA